MHNYATGVKMAFLLRVRRRRRSNKWTIQECAIQGLRRCEAVAWVGPRFSQHADYPNIQPRQWSAGGNVEPQVVEIVRGDFHPGFLNRLDEIILFHQLEQNEMAPIVDIQVSRIGKPLANRKVTLT